MKRREVIQHGDGDAPRAKRQPRELSAAAIEGLCRQTYLDTDETCHYLRFETLDALYAWMRRHVVPRFKRGRILLFARRDLDAVLAGTFRVETFIEETNQRVAPFRAPANRRRRTA